MNGDKENTKSICFWVAALVLLAFAGWLRFSQLDARPMHGDEANQAIRFGELLETGHYVYPPSDHHGPTMYYLTLPAAWLTGAKTTVDLREAHLRGTVAFFGLIGVALCLLWRRRLGRSGTLVAMAMAATSPMLVFHSRYYIQETILGVATLAAAAAAWWHWQRPSPWRAATFGALVGFALATKETGVLAMAAGVAAAAVVIWRTRPEAGRWRRVCAGRNVVAGIAAIVLMACLWLSSFMTNPRGPIDFVASYAGYVDRGLGGEAATAGDTHGEAHVHPPTFFVKKLVGNWTGRGAWRGLWRNNAARPMTELPWLVLALAGSGLAWRQRRPVVLFAAALSVLTLIAYSILPYKTPWCAATTVYLALIPAGYAALCGWRKGTVWQVAVGCWVALVAFDNWRQTRLSVGDMAADRRNPWVYAHPVSDVKSLATEVERMAGEAPATVVVVCQDPWQSGRGTRREGYLGGGDGF
jgi:uncharacterized protein (TIGR03663 family)